MVKRRVSPRIYITWSKYAQPTIGAEIAKYMYFWGFRLSIELFKLTICLTTHKLEVLDNREKSWIEEMNERTMPKWKKLLRKIIKVY